MSYRPRLFSIPNERALWRYFEKSAGYLENERVYTIAGIYSEDTSSLYRKLVEAWKEDCIIRKEEVVAQTLSSLSEAHVSVEDIKGKKLNPDGIGYE